jgi:single-strand DNA-binding protein
MLQQITMVGNLGSDPQLRYTPNDVAVCTFPLAVHKQWQRSDGAKGEKTLWFRITTWGKQAEAVNQYLTKGRQALVVGEIAEVRPYETKKGDPAVAVEVTAHIVQFLDHAPELSPANSGQPTQLRMLDDADYGELAELDLPLFA